MNLKNNIEESLKDYSFAGLDSTLAKLHGAYIKEMKELQFHMDQLLSFAGTHCILILSYVAGTRRVRRLSITSI